MRPMPRFEDAPLGIDRFRLFRFKSGCPHIELEIKTFKIYRAPTYRAISYCWGHKADGTVSVQCNGDPFEIWANLNDALQRLHREASGCWYWCDAICIEQGEEDVAVKEKLQQISFMETIFTLAEPVTVWLGGASTAEEQAFSHIVDQCEAAVHDGVARHGTKLPDPKDEIWRYWAQILLRPWFIRLWICQEALISDGKVVVLLGDSAETTWATLREAMDRTQCVPWTDEWLEYDDLDVRARLTIDRDFHTEWGVTLDAYEKAKMSRNDAVKQQLYQNVVNIQELMFLEKYHDADFGFLQQTLKVFGNRKCSYDQDRPNAMRGLLPERLKKGLKAYSINTDVATVYREVTHLWLTNDPTLSLLQRIRPLSSFLPKDQASLGTKLNNPSWVIDLARVVTEALGAGIPNRKDGFHAGLLRATKKGMFQHDRQAWVVPNVDLTAKIKGIKNIEFPSEEECHISGVQIGVVEEVLLSDCKSVTLDPLRSKLPPQYYLDLRTWVEESLKLISAHHPDLKEAQEIHWRTLVNNRTNTKDPAVLSMFDTESKHSRLEAYTNFMRILKSECPEDIQQSVATTADYYSTVFLNERDFPNWFFTSNSFVGRSYGVPKPGDIVAVFFGAATPFLLRPVPANDTFQFVGEAYCSGVMQGEALLKTSKDGFPQRTFKLV